MKKLINQTSKKVYKIDDKKSLNEKLSMMKNKQKAFTITFQIRSFSFFVENWQKITTPRIQKCKFI